MAYTHGLVENNLLAVLTEVEAQPSVGEIFPSDLLSYPEHMAVLHEWIDNHGEHRIAYESLVCLLEAYPFHLSSSAAVKLLEVGLLMGLKTDRPEDDKFRLP